MASRKTNSTTTRTTTTAKKSTTGSRIPASSSAPAAPKTTSSTVAKTITKAERQKLIEQAAYFRAEKSGFQGNAQDHWNAAEAEISADLAKKKIRVV